MVRSDADRRLGRCEWAECAVIARGDRAAACLCGGQVPQLDAQDRGLDLVEAAVETDRLVAVLRGRAVDAQAAKLLGARRIVGGDRAAVARGAEVLRRKEREATKVAECAGGTAAQRRADRLRG